VNEVCFACPSTQRGRCDRPEAHEMLEILCRSTGSVKLMADYFLQINSEGFRPPPWTFSSTGGMITLTCGIRSPVPGRTGEPSKWEAWETGKVPRPPNSRSRVWARHLSASNAHQNIRQSPPDYPAPRPSFPTASERRLRCLTHPKNRKPIPKSIANLPNSIYNCGSHSKVATYRPMTNMGRWQ
jgi:hypothetical protein